MIPKLDKIDIKALVKEYPWAEKYPDLLYLLQELNEDIIKMKKMEEKEGPNPILFRLKGSYYTKVEKVYSSLFSHKPKEKEETKIDKKEIENQKKEEIKKRVIGEW